MSKTVTARIPVDLHDELLERCNHCGCNINDFVKESIAFMIYGSSDFNFGDEEDDESDEIKEPKVVLMD